MATKRAIKPYKATLSIGSMKLTSSGDSLLEAFNALKIESPKEKAILTVSKGKREVTKVFNIPKVKRFANNAITRGIWAKLLETAL